MITVKYSEEPFTNPITKTETIYFLPKIEIFLWCNHKVGKSIKCFVDTGSFVNIFPQEYALAFLGFSEKSLKRGLKMPILGVGGITKVAYGHTCDIQHPRFHIKNVMIYFMENQPYPLLGRKDFMDRFKTIIFDEENKQLELILPA